MRRLWAGTRRKPKNPGVTREYVGSLQAPIYNLRAEEPFTDRLGPKFAASPLKIRFNTTAKIDEHMDAHDMDKSNASKRGVPRKDLRNKQIDEWTEATDTAIAPSPNQLQQ